VSASSSASVQTESGGDCGDTIKRISQYQGVLLALIVHPILMIKTTGPCETLRDRRENKCTWGDIRTSFILLFILS